MTVTLLAYLSVTFFFVITPGVTTTIVIQRTIRSGVRAGAAAALGAALGNSTHATLAGLGLSVIVRNSPQLFTALAIAGALYLSWLGFWSLHRAFRGTTALVAVDTPLATGSAVREGWTGTVLNPSTVTFYLTVVPGFLPSGGSAWAFALFAAIHVTMAFVSHLTWATAFGRLRVALSNPVALRSMDALAGLALILLGALLLLT